VRLRSSEWLLIGFFGYVAIVARALPPAMLALAIPVLLAALAFGEARVHREFFRDFFSEKGAPGGPN